MPASSGWRSSTRGSSQLELGSDSTFLCSLLKRKKERRGKWSLTLNWRQRLIRMENIAVAYVVGNVQRRHKAQHVRQHQRKREPTADRRRNHERDERPGERREESAEEKYRYDVTKNRPPIGERRTKACRKRSDGARILEHDERRRPPEREQRRDRAQRSQQHPELDLRIGQRIRKALRDCVLVELLRRRVCD